MQHFWTLAIFLLFLGFVCGKTSISRVIPPTNSTKSGTGARGQKVEVQINVVEKLKWLMGHWKTYSDGKVFWPTIPKMTYREELFIHEAPVAAEVGIKFLNFS